MDALLDGPSELLIDGVEDVADTICAVSVALRDGDLFRCTSDARLSHRRDLVPVRRPLQPDLSGHTGRAIFLPLRV
jgi:hypothetical protein